MIHSKFGFKDKDSKNKIFAVVLLASFFITLALPIAVSAQTRRPNFFDRIRLALFPPRRSLGIPPDDRQGGAVRGLCPVNSSAPLTAVVPNESWKRQTISERPTFWFYIPYDLSNQNSINFTVIDPVEEDEVNSQPEEIELQTNYSHNLSGTPGFVGIAIAPDGRPLEIGKRYRWVLSVNCNASDSLDDPISRSGDIAVKGWIERVELESDLAEELDAASPQDQVVIFGREGLWFDMINALAELRLNNPSDSEATETWVDMLECLVLGDEEEENNEENCVERQSDISSAPLRSFEHYRQSP